MIPWVEKYRPKKGDEVPQPFAVEALRKFLEGKSKKKAALLYGPPGSAKTSSVTALANELGYELVEINSSDFRNADQIEQRVGGAVRQASLFGNKKLVLVDEVDGIAGNKDRGGVPALIKIVQTTPTPIILTANDPWHSKLSGLRSKCLMVELKTLTHLQILKVLQTLCEKEGIQAEETVLKTLSRRAGGDLRAGINDLQSLAQQGPITAKSLESLGDRDQEESMFEALIKILKGSDPEVAVNALNNVSEDPQKALQWIQENVPKEYQRHDLVRAIDALSKANIFLGRIRRQQYWRFLSHAMILGTAGVAVAKDEKPQGFTKYSPPQMGLKIWRSRMKYAKRDSIVQKLATISHCSKKKAAEMMPYIQLIAKKQGNALQESLELDDAEIEWLRQ